MIRLFRPAVAAVTVLGLVAGCAQIQMSPINPLNWFGGARSDATVPEPDGGLVAAPPPLVDGAVSAPPDLRQPLERVASVSIDRTPDSVLVTARGEARSAGAFNAALVPIGIEGRTLVLEFRAELSATPVAGRSDLTAGYVIPGDLARALASVRIMARQNAVNRGL